MFTQLFKNFTLSYCWGLYDQTPIEPVCKGICPVGASLMSLMSLQMTRSELAGQLPSTVTWDFQTTRYLGND